MWFLFGEVSSSSGYLGWATLFYCCTPEPSYNYFGVCYFLRFSADELMYPGPSVVCIFVIESTLLAK